MSDLREKIQNRYLYFREKRVTIFVLLFVIALNLLLVILGCVLLKFLPDNKGLSMSDTFWESLKLLLDPGGFLGNRLSAVATIVTIIIVLCGSITFTGGVIGYVTNYITTKIDDTKSGRRDINIYGAILILNWNDRALSLILDYYSDPKINTADTYFIILSSCEREVVEKRISRAITEYRFENAVFNSKSPRILVRTGSTTSYSDLAAVNAFYAESIYIFQPEDALDPDYEVMRTFLALDRAIDFFTTAIESVMEEEGAIDSKMKEEPARTSIVIETTSFITGRLIDDFEISSGETSVYTPLTISNEFTLGKLFAAIALMPDVCKVYQEILSTSGSTLVDVYADEKASIEDELTAYTSAIPLYDYSEDDISTRTYLVYGSDVSDEALAKADKPYISERQIDPISPDLSLDGSEIIIVGINSKLPYILNALLAYDRNYSKAPCSVVLVVTEEQADDAEELYDSGDYKTLFSKKKKYVTISDNYAIEEYKNQVGKDFHAMFILSLDDVEEEDVDKNVIETYMAWKNEMERDDEISEQLHGKMIFEVKQKRNAYLIESEQDNHVVVSNQLISLFMVRMGKGETLQEIILDMISADGDTDYEDETVAIRNKCDLLTVNVEKFFGTKELPIFTSKHDLISQVYNATGGAYIPIGIVSKGTLYVLTDSVFSAKDRKELAMKEKPSLSNGYLVERDGTSIRYEDDVDTEKHLLLNPEDNLVVIRKT